MSPPSGLIQNYASVAPLLQGSITLAESISESTTGFHVGNIFPHRWEDAFAHFTRYAWSVGKWTDQAFLKRGSHEQTS
jgi:hypothetical protein